MKRQHLIASGLLVIGLTPMLAKYQCDRSAIESQPKAIISRNLADSANTCTIMLKGIVKDQKNNRLEGVRVYSAGADSVTYTDKKGKFQFTYECHKGDSIAIEVFLEGYEKRNIVSPWREPEIITCPYCAHQKTNGNKEKTQTYPETYSFVFDLLLEKLPTRKK